MNGNFFVNRSNLPNLVTSNIISYQRRHSIELAETHSDIKPFVTASLLNFSQKGHKKKRNVDMRQVRLVNQTMKDIQVQVQLPVLRRHRERKGEYTMNKHLSQLSKSSSQLTLLADRIGGVQDGKKAHELGRNDVEERVQQRLRFLGEGLFDDENMKKPKSPNVVKPEQKRQSFLGAVLKDRKGSFVAVKTFLNFRRQSIEDALFKDRMDFHRQFFRQLFNNLVQLRELGFHIGSGFHGVTAQIYEFLFVKGKLKYRNGDKMFDAFLDHEQYLLNVRSAKEFVEKLEGSEFFVHFNYFGKSVKTKLSERMKFWVENNVGRKVQLQEEIARQLNQLPGKHIRTVCVPVQFKQPNQSLKEAVDQISRSLQHLSFVDDVQVMKSEMYESEERQLNQQRMQCGW